MYMYDIYIDTWQISFNCKSTNHTNYCIRSVHLFFFFFVNRFVRVFISCVYDEYSYACVYIYGAEGVRR